MTVMSGVTMVAAVAAVAAMTAFGLGHIRRTESADHYEYREQILHGCNPFDVKAFCSHRQFAPA